MQLAAALHIYSITHSLFHVVQERKRKKRKEKKYTEDMISKSCCLCVMTDNDRLLVLPVKSSISY